MDGRNRVASTMQEYVTTELQLFDASLIKLVRDGKGDILVPLHTRRHGYSSLVYCRYTGVSQQQCIYLKDLLNL